MSFAKSNKIHIEVPQADKQKNPIVYIVVTVVMAIVTGLLTYFNIDLNLKVNDLENQEGIEIVIDTGAKIELAEDQGIETEIETDDGDILTLSLPVVESIDGGEIQVTEDELDLGKGEFYNFETPTAFKDATLGLCIDADDKYGSQCVDISAVYWKEYTNRWITTCGTGTARGIWNCKEENAGTEFDLITDINELQAGDWIVFDTGIYGHIGMALGSNNNGYIALLGENQGGTSCSGGGSATNIINISLKTFKGAFRPKIYNVPKVPDTGISSKGV